VNGSCIDCQGQNWGLICLSWFVHICFIFKVTLQRDVEYVLSTHKSKQRQWLFILKAVTELQCNDPSDFHMQAIILLSTEFFH